MAKRACTRLSAVHASIREGIVTGEYGPGRRLPTRVELEKKYGVSWLTVQQAVGQLEQEGFVASRGRVGTFVTDYPPHLCRYGFVYSTPQTPYTNWSLFWLALQREVRAHNGVDGRTVLEYYHDHAQPESGNYQRLLGNCREHLLAGLIFVTPPHGLEQSPLLTDPNIKRAGIMLEPHEGIPTLSCDFPEFYRRAFTHFAQRGKWRLAMILGEGNHDKPVMPWTKDLKASGLTTRPEWVHHLYLGAGYTARSIVQLLMSAAPEERPDALLVSDDNLVEGVLSGLATARGGAGQEVEVVAHWNFPNRVPRIMPVTYLGFDCGQIVRSCLECIDRQRAGEPVSPRSLIAPIFESEWSKNTVSTLKHE